MAKDIEDGSDSDLKYYLNQEAQTQGNRSIKFAFALQSTCKRARKQGCLDLVTEIVKRILTKAEVPNHRWMPYLRLGQEMASPAMKGQWFRIDEIKLTAINRRLEAEIVDEIAEIFGE